MDQISNLSEKLKIAKEEILKFERKTNNIIVNDSKLRWYPECHNDPKKKECNHCMNCWPKDCNGSNCDRVGRCMCQGTDCICLGRP